MLDPHRAWEHPKGVWHWASDYGFLCAETYPTRDEALAALERYRANLDALAGTEWTEP